MALLKSEYGELKKIWGNSKENEIFTNGKKRKKSFKSLFLDFLHIRVIRKYYYSSIRKFPDLLLYFYIRKKPKIYKMTKF